MSKTAVQVMKGAEATRPIVEKVVATETVPVEVDNKLSELQNQRRAALRLLKARKAREDLIAFTQFTMPDPEDPDNADLSRYDPQYFHRALAQALQDVESGKIPRLIITFPPRHGKLCADNTPVLTADGWKRHGDLVVGDYVFGPDGLPTRVMAVSAPDMASLRVTMTDGSSVVVHPNHEWTVWQRGGFRSDWITLETRDLMDRKLLSGTAKPRATYQIPLRPCVSFPERRLRMHPYALGAWLGDGSTSKACITHHPAEHEVIEAVTACGYAPSAVWTHRVTGVLTTAFSGDRPNNLGVMGKDLTAIGVIGNKHIPDAYKRSSVQQRLDLLAGLIDTGGSVSRNGRVRIATVSEVLADDIAEVVTSLGWHACKYKQAPSLSTSGIQGTKPVFYVGFNPDIEIPTRIPRKRITRLAPRRRVGIASIKPCSPEMGRCIEVEREDGLYCVGHEMIVTHNSELSSKRFPAWYIGRDPYRYVAVATYNQTFAEDFGKAVRATMLSPGYRQIFPGTNLRTGSKASDRLETEEGGALYFIGRGGTITGRGADLIIIDDPIKNSEEARSQLVRDQLWEWFQNDIKSRFMTDMGAMIIIQTRWHEDDLVGRLTDPTNPHYDALEAENWKIIDIPAIARDDDVLGRAAGEPLWPERFGLDYLENFKRANPKGFSALYQQRPTPEDGDFFTADMIKTYKAGDLPDRLRIYAASDHAVGVKQENDRTCMLVVGVDDRGCIWLLDCWWRRAKTDVVVEQMITMMDRWKPLRWWAESGHISKSIGPFLMKRMAERRVYCHISEQVPSKDKSTRAQSIQGRMSMGFVRFPMFEGWFEDAKQELLKFPEGRHDDFVDTLAHIGLGLDKIVNGTPQPVVESRGPRVGSLAWVKQASEYRKRQERVLHNLRGM